ncbi:MAG: tripartite tricarboxylate transporter substrate binding protein [Burkholderiales bacterium]
MARAFAAVAGAELGQKVIVDNRPGASGTIAAESVAKSPPDGYTLLYGINFELALVPAMGQNIAYDPDSSFAAVTGMDTGYYGLFVIPSLGVKTLAEFITLAKAKPGTISYGSAGNASMQHFLADLFCKKLDLEMNHVPYKGEAPAITDMLGGHIQAVFAVPAAILSHVKSGKAVPLVDAAPKRFISLPDIPTAQESGIEELDIAAWGGILAPAGTPRYHRQAQRGLRQSA